MNVTFLVYCKATGAAKDEGATEEGTDQILGGEEKKQKQIWREGENSREPRKKDRARNFPYMGTRVRAHTEAGRSGSIQGSVQGPRVIVTRRASTRRVSSAAAEKPGDARARPGKRQR